MKKYNGKNNRHFHPIKFNQLPQKNKNVLEEFRRKLLYTTQFINFFIVLKITKFYEVFHNFKNCVTQKKKCYSMVFKLIQFQDENFIEKHK